MAVVVVMVCGAHGWFLMGEFKGWRGDGEVFCVGVGVGGWVEVQMISMADAQEAA